jgi:hypothetical protein
VLKSFFDTLISVGFFVRMPFPLGLRVIAGKNDSLVPWAWGINGCLSVISTVLATIVSAEGGFGWIMIVAAAAYGAVFVINSFNRHNHASIT